MVQPMPPVTLPIILALCATVMGADFVARGQGRRSVIPIDSSNDRLHGPAVERAISMQQRTRELLADLDSADWFSTVGQPFPEPIPNEVIFISSWAEAVECCDSISWENYTLDQRNILTSHLHDHARDRYRCWNQIVDEVKAASNPMLERKIGPIVKDRALPEIVGHSVRWDVLGACMKQGSTPTSPTAFFTDLMGWYKRGRFPCGWGEVDQSEKSRLARDLSLMVLTRSAVPSTSRSSNPRSRCQRESSLSSEAH